MSSYRQLHFCGWGFFPAFAGARFNLNLKRLIRFALQWRKAEKSRK
jgi:hypothetical protein